MLARWQEMGLRPRAIDYAFEAVKRQETIVANMPLVWNIPSIDGFDGGLLPTEYYSAFTSLLLPEGALRTIDGRLREILAREECRGACIPENRWLSLMNVQYVLTDKLYDRNYDGIFYDTQLRFPIRPWTPYTLENLPEFEADSLHILYSGDVLPEGAFTDADGETVTLQPVEGDEPVIDNFKLARLTTDTAMAPVSITLNLAADVEIDIRALTLVDTRTGDFLQLTPRNWSRIYSADVKIYQNLGVWPRAFVVHEAITAPDSWLGTEIALDVMRDLRFNPARTVVLNSDSRAVVDYAIGRHPWLDPVSTAQIVEYTPTRVVIELEAGGPGYLVLTDAFYPEWRATVNGEAALIYRADVMFRAVQVPAGQSTVVFEYSNNSFHLGLLITIIFVLGCALVGGGWRIKARRARY